MTGDSAQSPAAARAGLDNDAPNRRKIDEELARFTAVLEEIGPADPAVEPGVDLRRRLVRAARSSSQT